MKATANFLYFFGKVLLAWALGAICAAFGLRYLNGTVQPTLVLFGSFAGVCVAVTLGLIK